MVRFGSTDGEMMESMLLLEAKVGVTLLAKKGLELGSVVGLKDGS